MIASNGSKQRKCGIMDSILNRKWPLLQNLYAEPVSRMFLSYEIATLLLTTYNVCLFSFCRF